MKSSTIREKISTNEYNRQIIKNKFLYKNILLKKKQEKLIKTKLSDPNLLANNLICMEPRTIFTTEHKILESKNYNDHEHYFYELNKIIKKINLSFSQKKAIVQFDIKDGIFRNAIFNLKFNEEKLSILVNNASLNAKTLLSSNTNALSSRLLNKGIWLDFIKFET